MDFFEASLFPCIGALGRRSTFEAANNGEHCR